ncbi:MAG: TIGR04388 family protein, partial [Spirochaetota bacterium]
MKSKSDKQQVSIWKHVAHIGLFVSLLYFLLFPTTNLFAQALPTPLMGDPFDPQRLQEDFNQAFVLRDLNSWDSYIDDKLQTYRAEWEFNLDSQITNQIGQVSGTDFYNDTETYKQYFERVLNSEKESLYTNWESEANALILTEREKYLGNYIGNILDNVQDASDATNTQTNDFLNLPTELLESFQSWYENYQEALQDGKTEFDQQAIELYKEYTEFSQNLKQQKQKYQENLQTAYSYKINVVNGIDGEISYFKSQLYDRSNLSLYTEFLYDGQHTNLDEYIETHKDNTSLDIDAEIAAGRIRFSEAGEDLAELIDNLYTRTTPMNLAYLKQNLHNTFLYNPDSFFDLPNGQSLEPGVDYSAQVTDGSLSLNELGQNMQDLLKGFADNNISDINTQVDAILSKINDKANLQTFLAEGQSVADVANDAGTKINDANDVGVKKAYYEGWFNYEKEVTADDGSKTKENVSRLSHMANGLFYSIYSLKDKLDTLDMTIDWSTLDLSEMDYSTVLSELSTDVIDYLDTQEKYTKQKFTDFKNAADQQEYNGKPIATLDSAIVNGELYITNEYYRKNDKYVATEIFNEKDVIYQSIKAYIDNPDAANLSFLKQVVTDRFYDGKVDDYKILNIHNADLYAYSPTTAGNWNKLGEWSRGADYKKVRDSQLVIDNVISQYSVSDFTHYAERWLICKGIALCVGENQAQKETHFYYRFNYTVRDQNIYEKYKTWEEFNKEMNSQLSHWKNNVKPSVTQWEASVNHYKTVVDTWTKEADDLLQEAENRYKEALKNLNKEKNTWFAKMKEEENKNRSTWDVLLTTAQYLVTRNATNETETAADIRSAAPVFEDSNFTIASVQPGVFNQDLEALKKKTFTVEGDREAGIRTETYTIYDAEIEVPELDTEKLNFKDIFSNALNGAFNFTRLDGYNNVIDRAEESYWETFAVEATKSYRFIAHDYTEGSALYTKDEEGKIVLTTKAIEEMNNCYKNFSSAELAGELANQGHCSTYLRKASDEEFSYSRKGNKLYINRSVFTGRLGEKQADGSYAAEKTTKTEVITLSTFKHVGLPGSNGEESVANGGTSHPTLFSRWDYDTLTSINNIVYGEYDYTDPDKPKLITPGLLDTESKFNNDSNSLQAANTRIDTLNEYNRQFYMANATRQSQLDYVFEQLATAMITGGAQGARATAQQLFEGQVNAQIAQFIGEAQGMSPEQIAEFTQLVTIVRGRIRADKIKRRIDGSANRYMSGYFDHIGKQMGGDFGKIFQKIGNGMHLLEQRIITPALNYSRSVMAGFALPLLGAYIPKHSNPLYSRRLTHIRDSKAEIKNLQAQEQHIITEAITEQVVAATGIHPSVIETILTDRAGRLAARRNRRVTSISRPISMLLKKSIIGVTTKLMNMFAVGVFRVSSKETAENIRTGTETASGLTTNSQAEAFNLGLSDIFLNIFEVGAVQDAYLQPTEDQRNKEIVKEKIAIAFAEHLGLPESTVKAIVDKEVQRLDDKKAYKQSIQNAHKEMAKLVVKAIIAALTVGKSEIFSAKQEITQQGADMAANAEKTINSIGGFLSKAGDTLSGIWEGFQAFMSDPFSAIADAGSAVANLGSNFFSTGWDGITTVASAIGNAGKAILEGAQTLFTNPQAFFDSTLELAGTGIEAGWDSLMGIGFDAVEKMQDVLTLLQENPAEFIANYNQILNQAVDSLFDGKEGNAIDKMKAALLNQLSSMVSNALVGVGITPTIGEDGEVSFEVNMGDNVSINVGQGTPTTIGIGDSDFDQINIGPGGISYDNGSYGSMFYDPATGSFGVDLPPGATNPFTELETSITDIQSIINGDHSLYADFENVVSDIESYANPNSPNYPGNIASNIQNSIDNALALPDPSEITGNVIDLAIGQPVKDFSDDVLGEIQSYTGSVEQLISPTNPSSLTSQINLITSTVNNTMQNLTGDALGSVQAIASNLAAIQQDLATITGSLTAPIDNLTSDLNDNSVVNQISTIQDNLDNITNLTDQGSSQLLQTVNNEIGNITNPENPNSITYNLNQISQITEGITSPDDPNSIVSRLNQTVEQLQRVLAVEQAKAIQDYANAQISGTEMIRDAVQHSTNSFLATMGFGQTLPTGMTLPGSEGGADGSGTTTGTEEEPVTQEQLAAVLAHLGEEEAESFLRFLAENGGATTMAGLIALLAAYMQRRREEEDELEEGEDGEDSTGTGNGLEGDLEVGERGEDTISQEGSLVTDPYIRHNIELLQNYYYATTEVQAKELLEEMIEKDPDNASLYTEALQEAISTWHSLPTYAEQMEQLGRPSEEFMHEMLGEKEPGVAMASTQILLGGRGGPAPDGSYIGEDSNTFSQEEEEREYDIGSIPAEIQEKFKENPTTAPVTVFLDNVYKLSEKVMDGIASFAELKELSEEFPETNSINEEMGLHKDNIELLKNFVYKTSKNSPSTAAANLLAELIARTPDSIHVYTNAFREAEEALNSDPKPKPTKEDVPVDLKSTINQITTITNKTISEVSPTYERFVHNNAIITNYFSARGYSAAENLLKHIQKEDPVNAYRYRQAFNDFAGSDEYKDHGYYYDADSSHKKKMDKAGKNHLNDLLRWKLTDLKLDDNFWRKGNEELQQEALKKILQIPREVVISKEQEYKLLDTMLTNPNDLYLEIQKLPESESLTKADKITLQAEYRQKVKELNKPLPNPENNTITPEQLKYDFDQIQDPYLKGKVGKAVYASQEELNRVIKYLKSEGVPINVVENLQKFHSKRQEILNDLQNKQDYMEVASEEILKLQEPFNDWNWNPFKNVYPKTYDELKEEAQALFAEKYATEGGLEEAKKVMKEKILLSGLKTDEKMEILQDVGYGIEELNNNKHTTPITKIDIQSAFESEAIEANIQKNVELIDHIFVLNNEANSKKFIEEQFRDDPKKQYYLDKLQENKDIWDNKVAKPLSNVELENLRNDKREKAHTYFDSFLSAEDKEKILYRKTYQIGDLLNEKVKPSTNSEEITNELVLNNLYKIVRPYQKELEKFRRTTNFRKHYAETKEESDALEKEYKKQEKFVKEIEEEIRWREKDEQANLGNFPNGLLKHSFVESTLINDFTKVEASVIISRFLQQEPRLEKEFDRAYQTIYDEIINIKVDDDKKNDQNEINKIEEKKATLLDLLNILKKYCVSNNANLESRRVILQELKEKYQLTNKEKEKSKIRVDGAIIK